MQFIERQSWKKKELLGHQNVAGNILWSPNTFIDNSHSVLHCFCRVHPIVYVLNMSCIMLFIFDLVVHIIFLTWPVFWSRRTEGGWWNGWDFIHSQLLVITYILKKQPCDWLNEEEQDSQELPKRIFWNALSLYLKL